ncbi:amidase [soil metagenome]
MLIPSDPVHAFIDHPDVPVPNAPAGPLAGLTFAVKDIFDVAGYVTGCGNPEKRADGTPARAHAPVVSALLGAGARFVGKTHTAELAFSLDGRNEHYGTPINPAAPGRVPGGSSSGSAAAVAAGLVDIALGSDTGGSVRGPASFCGLIGLRTTFGRIDISRTMPLAQMFDTVGWFARTPEIYERVGAVLLGDDDEGPPLRRMIVAADSREIFAGETGDPVFAPTLAAVARHLVASDSVRIASEGLERWADVYRTLQGFQAWKNHGPWIATRKPDLNPAARARFDLASRVTERQYREAGAARSAMAARIAEIVGDDGVLVQPTMPGIAPRLEADENEFEHFRGKALPMLCIAGLSGFPQISVPLMQAEGCPIGLSLIGPPGRDRALIALARALLSA